MYGHFYSLVLQLFKFRFQWKLRKPQLPNKEFDYFMQQPSSIGPIVDNVEGISFFHEQFQMYHKQAKITIFKTWDT